MRYRVTRNYGPFMPGDMLVATPARVKEIAFAKFAEPLGESREQEISDDKPLIKLKKAAR